jgi:hypothetical protein
MGSSPIACNAPHSCAWPGPHRPQFIAAGTTGSRRAADTGLITPAHRLFPPARRNIRATLGRLIPNFSAISFHFSPASRSFTTRAWSLRRGAPPFTPAGKSPDHCVRPARRQAGRNPAQTTFGRDAELLLSSGSLSGLDGELMKTINRSAVAVTQAQPFLDWLHQADPTSAHLTL